MTVLMERHGETLTIGDSTMTIPDNVSALSMSVNQLRDGHHYDRDGYVYKEGKRVGKWFSPFRIQYRIWEPKLNDPVMLESKFYAAKEACRKFYEEIYKPRIKTLLEHRPFYGINKHGVVIYFDKDHDYEQFCQKGDQPPECEFNQELIDRWCELENRLRHHNVVTYLYREALAEALGMIAQRKYPSAKSHELFLIKVNNDHLIQYNRACNHYELVEYKRINELG